MKLFAGYNEEEFIKEVLGKEDADRVGSIPLSRLGLKDKQIWSFTKSGNFSMNSAYHLDMSLNKKVKSESSSINNDSIV